MIRNKNAKNSNVRQNNINKLNFLFQQVEYKFVEDLLKVEVEIKNVSYLHIHFVTLTHLYDIFKCNNSRPFFESWKKEVCQSDVKEARFLKFVILKLNIITE